MNNFTIYLAGAMTGLSFKAMTDWRIKVKQELLKTSAKSLAVINPVDYYNFSYPQHDTEREVMEYDLWRLKSSDLIIVNFNNPDSIGTSMELMCAKENNIPIIGLYEDKYYTDIHPWLKECCNKVLFTMKDLINYVSEFYLME